MIWDIVTAILGAATIAGGLFGRNFYPGLPGPRSGARAKPVPRWLGRLWFVAIGSWVLYMGPGRSASISIPRWVGFLVFVPLTLLVIFYPVLWTAARRAARVRWK